MRDATTYLDNINMMSIIVTDLSGNLQAGVSKSNIIRNLCIQDLMIAASSGATIIKGQPLPHHQEDLLSGVIPGGAKCETLASVVLEVAWKPARTMTSMLGACCPRSKSPEVKAELERSTAMGAPADVETVSS